jgi:hypothetical protein
MAPAREAGSEDIGCFYGDTRQAASGDGYLS